LSPRLLYAERGWIASAVVLAAGRVWHDMAILGDGFWCLAGGEFVLRTGALPAADPFAFTSRHMPWILDMPLFQVGGAWLVAHLGLRSLMVACTLSVVAAAATAWLGLARSTWARLCAFPVMLLYLASQARDVSARAQSFADVCLVVLLLLLVRARRGTRVHPACALLLGAAWANLHPSFLLVAILPAAFAAAERLEPQPLRAPVRPMLLLAGLALLGACVNPYTVMLFVDVGMVLGNPTTRYVDLFQPPDFRDPAALAPIALAAILALWLARRPAGERWRADAALLLGFTAAACLARRHGPALVALEALLVADRASSVAGPAMPRWVAGALAGAAAAQIALGVWWLADRKDPFRDVPAESAALVERLGLPDRMLNPYHWGGYLDWSWAGRRKVFIDGRGELFSNGVFDDAMRIANVAPEAATLLDVYEIRTVLWERGTPLDAALAHDPRWREVHRDRLAVVYVRK
jgi:hypothetical protein